MLLLETSRGSLASDTRLWLLLRLLFFLLLFAKAIVYDKSRLVQQLSTGVVSNLTGVAASCCRDGLLALGVFCGPSEVFLRIDEFLVLIEKSLLQLIVRLRVVTVVQEFLRLKLEDLLCDFLLLCEVFSLLVLLGRRFGLNVRCRLASCQFAGCRHQVRNQLLVEAGHVLHRACFIHTVDQVGRGCDLTDPLSWLIRTF